MTVAVLVIAERVTGEHPDVTFELLGKGRELADELSGELGVIVANDIGQEATFGVADALYLVEGMEAGYSAPQWEMAIGAVIESVSPQVILVSTGTVGIDLGGALATRFNTPIASYVLDAVMQDGCLVVTSQLYGGKLLSEGEIDTFPAFVSVLPGSLSADKGRAVGSPRVERFNISDQLATVKGRGVELREPDSSGVDITAAPLLVSVGRGIGSKENLELVAELAEAMKAPLSASRPVIDQGWLPKPHQVGKSGKKVKPAVYLAFGISGAPEHLEGMRNAETIIACNTDPNAPIFEIAHYGTTLDLFDLVPELTDIVGG
ncbi:MULTISPECIES: electron transfer flavoprotein subunit alpha/FixB family protein [Ferrimicrobium]|jgi:electron transfer flavoprotein alpha subunit|uniref:electron transfer flavoprotein subunit alpha/FixB family protein n=1 Tax=Ferrimicrobium TaxID=121038 RepID=UPI0023F146D8|nr:MULTISPECIES: electron transfer flavoprotein subunit alpha/FixB family protein [Ferrimicrobium]MCL5052986.1 electron transfer flavoprotein subunit alpha/FixB family protein [Gammaproteobacteria bacterium]